MVERGDANGVSAIRSLVRSLKTGVFGIGVDIGVIDDGRSRVGAYGLTTLKGVREDDVGLGVHFGVWSGFGTRFPVFVMFLLFVILFDSLRAVRCGREDPSND